MGAGSRAPWWCRAKEAARQRGAVGVSWVTKHTGARPDRRPMALKLNLPWLPCAHTPAVGSHQCSGRSGSRRRRVGRQCSAVAAPACRRLPPFGLHGGAPPDPMTGPLLHGTSCGKQHLSITLHLQLQLRGRQLHQEMAIAPRLPSCNRRRLQCRPAGRRDAAGSGPAAHAGLLWVACCLGEADAKKLGHVRSWGHCRCASGSGLFPTRLPH